MKVVLLEASLMNFILWISQGDQKEGESGVIGSIIDTVHSWDIQRVQIEGESGVTRSIIDERHFSDMQRDQMEC